MCVLKFLNKMHYICMLKVDMSLVTSFFVLLEESEEHTSDLRSLRNNVAGCGDQKHLPRGVHRFSRPCMDVVSQEAINEVVLRWVAQKLCWRFGYRITYFWYFLYPFSKLRDLHAFGLARSVAKMRKFLITSGVRCPSQCVSPAETTAKRKRRRARHLTGESAT